MRSAIEIFCSRVVFRQRFFRKNNEMADEYDANAGGNRGSLLTVILANVLWTLRLQELVKQRVLWNVYASVFSRLSVTEWVDVKSDLSLQTSELVRVLFAFCSMTPVPTTMATLCLHLWSIIGSLKLISTLRLSIQTVGQASGFVQPWMGDSATPRSSTSSTWSRWYRPHRFVGICLAFNWFESICLLFTVYDYCTIKQCSYDMFIILKYNTHRVDRWSLFQPNTHV